MEWLRCSALLLLLSWAGVVDAQTPPVPSEGATGDTEGTSEGDVVEPDEPERPRPLRVGVSGSEPFVIREAERLDGISVAIWEALAQDLGVEFELVPVDTPNDAIDQVEAGTIDVAIGPISISSARARRVAFTQPYYESSISIAAPIRDPSVLDRLAPFVSSGFLGGAGALLFVLLVVGAVLWLVERKKNESIAMKPLSGIGTGVWLAIVTMTTVGYGDRVPETPAGRVVAGVWMLLSLVVVSSLTAFLATALTVAQLDDTTIAHAEELAERKVAVVDGTTSVAFASRFRARLVREPDLEDAVRAVIDERAEAVVYDRPILQWHLRELEDHGLTISEDRYEPLGYGFAVARDANELSHHLDVALLGLEESKDLEEIISRWL